MEEARDLALVLRAGAFSAPLEIVEQRSVGRRSARTPSTRASSPASSASSLVILIMIVYYRFAGSWPSSR
jgi:preprotein translocase subunit SecD